MIFKKSKLDEPYQSGVQLFPAIDIDKVKKELKLEKKGLEDGKSNLPRNDGETFNETEQSIVDLMNRERDRVNSVAHNNHLAYISRIENLNAHTKIQEIESLKNKTKAEIISKKIITDDSELYILKKEIIELEEKYADFKKENSLDRPPSFKESKILNFAIVFFLFLIESGVNSYFFAKGDELGILGGLMKSTIISLINIIVVGFFFGWVCSRYVVHKNIFKRIFGFLSVCITIMLSLGFNWLIAHYRSFYSQALANADVLSWNSFINDTFGILSVESIFLVTIGIFSVIICVFEFWSAYDHYPGYENFYRKLQILKDDYLESKREFIEEIAEIKDDGVKEIQSLMEKINGIQREQPTLVAKISSLNAQYEEHLIYLENVARRLLETYRQENLKNRENPPPKYWHEPWHFEFKNKYVFTIPESFQYIDLISDTLRKVGDYLNEIEICYTETISALHSLSDLGNLKNGNQDI